MKNILRQYSIVGKTDVLRNQLRYRSKMKTFMHRTARRVISKKSAIFQKNYDHCHMEVKPKQKSQAGFFVKNSA